MFCLLFCVFVSCAGEEKGTADDGENEKVAKISSRTIDPFDSLFVKINEIHLTRAGTPPLGEVTQLSVGPNGRILISDPAITRGVYLFSQDGDFLRRVGSYGTKFDEYLYPSFHGFDQRGNIYVYDGDRLVFLRFNEDGLFRSSLLIGKYFHKIAFDTRGDPFFYTTTYYDGRRLTDATVFHYAKDGQFLRKFSPAPVFDGRSGYHGGGIAIDLDNSVYVISPYEYKIDKYSRNGDLSFSFGIPPSGFRRMPSSTAIGSSRKSRENWHSAWTHIWSLLFFERGFLMIWMEDFEANQDQKPFTKDYFDLYNLEGKLVHSRVRLPDGETNYCANNNYLFSLRTKKAGTDSNLIDHTLCVYRLR
jgi:hypothetical protein